MQHTLQFKKGRNSLIPIFLILIVLATNCTGMLQQAPQNQQAQKFKIGDIASNDVVSVVINSVSTSHLLTNMNLIPNNVTPQAGNKFVIINATIKNIGGGDQYIYNPWYWQLYDQNNVGYTDKLNEAEFYLSQPLSIRILKSQEFLTGDIVFEIPENSIAKEIHYAPSRIIRADPTNITIELT